MQRPRSCEQDRGLCVCLKQSISVVAGPYPANTRQPAPAAWCGHHRAAAEAASQETVAVIALAVIAVAVMADTTGGSRGRNERGGAMAATVATATMVLRIMTNFLLGCNWM